VRPDDQRTGAVRDRLRAVQVVEVGVSNEDRVRLVDVGGAEPVGRRGADPVQVRVEE